MELPKITWRQNRIPMLVLGTAQLGIPGYGVANTVGDMGRHEVSDVVEAAWGAGVRFFDTAQAYGNSEERLGRAFASPAIFPAEPQVITKIDPKLDPEDADAVAASLERSLSRLGISSFWGVMLHSYSWMKHLSSGLGDALAVFRRSGRTRYLGVSVYSAEEALTALRHPDMELVQVPVNAWDDRIITEGVLEEARLRDKMLFLRSIFLQGLLLLEPAAAELKVKGSGRMARTWRELCAAQGQTPLTMALRWAAHLGYPVVLGAERSSQVFEVAEVLRRRRLNLNYAAVSEAMNGERDLHVLDPRLWQRRTM